ncbi:helix-turn-helix domain-containing protein [Patulibacter defluvii]|uniref:helix-turn-helix domain-containing protein n=1 Tax=Patulibacter defluvii TaxID=3095358 RepID=UPI002A75F173|nr:helix-turn-helix domain-containing protein [Patulibacter sp. DM4]
MSRSTVTPLRPASAPPAPSPPPAPEAPEVSLAARREIGAFLRAHRERTSPASVGLPATGRRRTPGLRREEVAALSGVGLAWYSWLEQGRVSTSKQVLEAVARTLRLDPTSTRHLLALAGHRPPALPAVDRPALTDGARALLEAWPASPAVLLDPYLDMTAWNPAFAAVWTDPATIEPLRRNLMWAIVGDPRLRAATVDWEPLARALLAQFRLQTAPRSEERRTRELYALLEEDFPDLRPWWRCQGVGDLTTRPLALRVDDEPVWLRTTAMRPVDDPDALLLVATPVGAADRRAVERAVAARPRLSRVG